MSDIATEKAINSASVDPIPTIPNPETTSITLLKGFPDRGLDAEVRELNGEDEEYLAGIEAKPNVSYGDWLTAVLRRSVVSIGGESPPGDLGQLISADRDILMLATVRATYGPTKEITVRCNTCGQSNDVVLDLEDDFPIKRPDFDIFSPIAVRTRKGTLHFNLPTGADLASVANEKLEAHANTIIISRCAVFPEGFEPADRLDWARKLNTDARRKATNALLAVELGPRLEVVDTHCANEECATQLLIGLNWVSLLFG